jgi:hypothetical protein
MSASNTLETNILNHFFRGVSTAANSTCYIGLFVSDPGEAGGGTEVSGGGYARKTATFGAPSDGAITNTNKVEYDVPTAPWGTITHWGVFTTSTGNTLLGSGAVNPPKAVSVGDPPFFNIGALTITCD